MTTKERLAFEDPCYPQELINRINMILCDFELNATEMWWEICKAEHNLYSHKENPNFQGLAHQLSLETEPRETLLILIMQKRIRGYRALLKSFSFPLPEEYR